MQNNIEISPVFANAKINIGLYVTGKRSDGYHNIQSVFYPVPLFDVLEWKPAGRFQLHLHGLPIPENGSPNILQSAWLDLSNQFHIPAICIHLLKNIPSGAGLGGGSSDAAFFLKSVNKIFSLGLDTQSMKKLALRWGSDCPFFTDNRPALVSGRGEIIQALPEFLSGYYLIIVYDNTFIGTADAFNRIIPKNMKHDLAQIVEKPVETWKNVLENEFEKIALKTHPQLNIVKQQLYEAGAVYASMTGSGSAFYGIFKTEPEKQNLPENILWKGYL